MTALEHMTIALRLREDVLTRRCCDALFPCLRCQAKRSAGRIHRALAENLLARVPSQRVTGSR